MSMTVGELKEILESLPDEMEVRLAFQPSWPLEYTVDQAQVVDLNVPDPEEEGPADDETQPVTPERGEPDEVLYLAEGNQIGYLPEAATRGLGWR